MRKGGEDWTQTANAIDRILAGERDEESLCEGLDFNSSMIIETIVQALADPSTLQDLIPADPGTAPPQT